MVIDRMALRSLSTASRWVVGSVIVWSPRIVAGQGSRQGGYRRSWTALQSDRFIRSCDHLSAVDDI